MSIIFSLTEVINNETGASNNILHATVLTNGVKTKFKSGRLCDDPRDVERDFFDQACIGLKEMLEEKFKNEIKFDMMTTDWKLKMLLQSHFPNIRVTTKKAFIDYFE